MAVAHTIVIGVEPGTAERVAWMGGELALSLEARVVLAHVRKDPPRLGSRQDRERARHGIGRRAGDVLDRASSALPPEVDADECVEAGGVAGRLADVAKRVDAALIVVGSREHRRLGAPQFRSVSQALAPKAPCPVMVVPGAPMGRPKPFGGGLGELPTMIAGMDGSAASSEAALFARALADSLGHRLVVLHLQGRAEAPLDALRAISTREDARMIVIAADHGDRGRFHLGRSLATRLPRVATCPVTLVPAGPR